MKLIRGKKISEKFLKDIKCEIKKEKLGLGLAVILVGEDEASEIYTRLKKEAAKKTGINFFEFRFTNETNNIRTQEKIINKIDQLNRDEKVSGIIVQLPLPKGLDTRKIINSIDPRKDADGFHSKNIELFFKNKERFWPVFPKAIIKMIETIPEINFENLRAIVIAKSSKFGEVMVEALKRKNIKARYILSSALTPRQNGGQATFSQGERGILNADIIITACGIPGLIKGGMIKKGAIIIDGGITKKGKKVLGDVDAESVKNIAGYLSPIPGGVGPVTVACLLENVLILGGKRKKYLLK